MFLKKNYVQQLDETDCGAAALSMILKQYHSDVSLTLIRKYAQTDRNGTTALGLIKAAGHFGLNSKAFQIEPHLFKKSFNEFEYPFIAHIENSQGFLHYIVILEANEHYVTIADPDPSIKIAKISHEKLNSIWTGIFIYMSPKKDYQQIQLGKSSLWKTARILTDHKPIILGIIIFMILSTAITIIGTFYLQNIIDVYVPQKKINLLSLMALGLLIAYIVHGLLNFIEGLWSTILGKRLTNKILLDYLYHLLSLPMDFFESRKSGELTSRFSDATNIITALAGTAITTILNVGTLIIISLVLLHISVRLFLTSLIIVPIYALIIFTFIPIFDKWNHTRMERNSEVSSLMIENLHGIESIKAMSTEKYVFTHFRKTFNNSLHANYIYGVLSVLQDSLKDAAELIITLTLLYLGALMAIKQQITAGQLVAFTALMSYYLEPIQEIISLQSEIQSASTANERINQIITTKPEKLGKIQQDLLLTPEIDYSINFKNISFEYKYGQEVLHNINLSIKSHRSSAIIGLSGSGKTTLVKLLIGFYSPSHGVIEVNNHNISDFTKKTLRTNIKYLPQKPNIFNGTIAENISFGNTNTSLQEIIKAAKIAEIHSDITQLPMGYDTQLSEDSGLSGGQLQRISIARIVLSKAPILILDESTSNLDLETEKKVLKNLNETNSTIIYIAHRLQVAKQADDIIVMKKGTVVENDTPTKLLEKKGAYYHLIS